MSENSYPKSDGDIYFGSEANQANYGRSGTTHSYGAVSVGTSATSINAASSTRVGIIIANAGSTTIYLGASGVTTADGYPLFAGKSIYFTTQDQIYGIVASGTESARYLEVEE